MNYDYKSVLSISLPRINSITEVALPPVSIPSVEGVTWTLKSLKSKTGLYCHLDSTADAISKHLLFSVEIRSGSKYFLQEFIEICSPKTSHKIKWSQLAEVSSFGNSCDPEKLDVKVTIRSPTPLTPYQKLLADLTSPELCDFTIQFDDGELQAHKFILSARSSVLRNMLSNKDCEESQKSIMKVVDASKEVFKIFIEFLSTAQTPNLSVQQTMELLIIADKYDVQDLKKICDENLVKYLKEDDPVHDVYQFTHTFNCSQELKKKSFELVISKYFKDKRLSEFGNQPDKVCKLVRKMEDFDETLNEMKEGERNCKRMRLDPGLDEN